MQETCSRSFLELVTELQALSEEVASLARHSEYEIQIFNEFAGIIEKFIPVFYDLKDNEKVMDTAPIRKAVESLEKELRRAKSLIICSVSRLIHKQMEVLTQDMGRSLGLVLFASVELKLDVKEKIGALHRELMNARFDKSLSSTPIQTPRTSLESGFISDFESAKATEIEEEIQEIVEERFKLGVDDVVLQLKHGEDKNLKFALLELRELVTTRAVDSEWISEEEIISVLFNRLGSSKPDNRLTVIQILRSLAIEFTEYKEKMADVGSLSVLVKSLTRDMEEQREAVGLLLALCHLPAVWRRIGRIQGCIVMLVAMFSGNDPVASLDAGKLLNALSSNTQNALHMAEAGYFKPLVQYLKEGSDMSKILMATALSRMDLTDQSRASLGEDGAIEPLVRMFQVGKLEAKLSALGAIQNMSLWADNVQRLVSTGIVAPLLQLLFSVTSVLMTLREPASAILAKIAESESILVNKEVAQQMLSLLNLCSPTVQCNLLQALNSVAAHSSAFNVRRKMKENSAIQLLLPFLMGTNTNIRNATLNLICTLSKDVSEELTEQLGDTYLNTLVHIISSSTSVNEKAAALGILSNLPVGNKKATELLKKTNLLPTVMSIISSSTVTETPSTPWLAESIAGILIRFTVASDRKLQQYSVEHGVIPLLVKLLSIGSVVAKCNAATSLAQLSQNSLSLGKSKRSRWLCVPPSGDAFCEVHEGYCFVKSTFCLVKAGAVSPLIQILEGKEREADEAVLGALATLLPDETWESGSKYLAKLSGTHAMIQVLESGNTKAQQKALWILERIFRIEEHRVQYGESAQAVLIDLAQKSDSRLKPAVAKLLAQLDLLQEQSSYF